MELNFETAINAENYTFNFSVLQQFSTKELSGWLKKNYSQIQSHILSRFKFLEDADTLAYMDARRFPYLSKASDMLPSLKFASVRQQPYAHFIALFGMAKPDSTCHEVIFGERKPVILRGQTLAVLEKFMQSSSRSKAEAYLTLGAYPAAVTNPVFTSYHRYSELAKESGRQVNQYLADFYTNAEFLRTIAAFREDVITPDDELLSYRSPARGAASLWWLTLLICPVADISVDYLYRDNYAFLAQHPERELTQEERQFLSVYLSASKDGQRLCRYNLLANDF